MRGGESLTSSAIGEEGVDKDGSGYIVGEN